MLVEGRINFSPVLGVRNIVYTGRAPGSLTEGRNWRLRAKCILFRVAVFVAGLFEGVNLYHNHLSLRTRLMYLRH